VPGAAELLQDRNKVTAIVIAGAVVALTFTVWLVVGVIVPSFDEAPCTGVEVRAPLDADPAKARDLPAIGGGGGAAAKVRSLFRGGAPVVHCHDFADPFVLREESAYFAYATNAADENVAVLTSGGLFGTAKKRDALPELPAWSDPGYVWAPAVLPRGDGYVMYYATRVKGTGRQCLSLALGSEPGGPFVDGSTGPFICPSGGGAIDAEPFVAGDGRVFLLWKNYNGVTGIVGQELSPDGRSLIGTMRLLIAADQQWEAGLVEAPSMVEHEGRYYLFYSGNDWATANYAIAYAVCTSPLGPCTKPADRPWLGSTASAQGPGSPDVFADEHGQLWIALHSWVRGKVGYPDGARNFFVVRLTFANGAPAVT
jgi:beta-xylosidase